MKKSIIFTACACATALFLTSCGSVPTAEPTVTEQIVSTTIENNNNIEKEESEEITLDETIITEESKEEEIQEQTEIETTTTEEEVTIPNSDEETVEIVEDEIIIDETISSDEEVILVLDEEETIDENAVFIDSLYNVNLSIPSAPKLVTVYNNFVRPFTISVVDNDDKPIPDFKITVKYPSDRVDGKIVYATENLITDKEGKCVYTANAPQFSALDVFSAYPTPINNDEDVMLAVKNNTVTTPWQVRSDIINKDQLLFVWDFKESGNPYKESEPLLSALKAEGIRIGNAPMSGDPSYFNGPAEQAYLDNYEMTGNSFGYLIYGTIKFTKSVTQTDEGDYECALKADIQAIRMKDGSVPFHKTFTQVGRGKNWNYCVDNAKTAISKQIANALLYEL